jgi:hypothetical protein
MMKILASYYHQCSVICKLFLVESVLQNVNRYTFTRFIQLVLLPSHKGISYFKVGTDDSLILNTDPIKKMRERERSHM